MTKEEKQLLLKDLCARVPYHPKGHVVNAFNGAECDEWLTCATFSMFTSVTNNSRLYLRPMSSMTEEERKEYKGFIIHREHVNAQGQEWDIDCFSFDSAPRLIDWLNAHHIDYRGLIEKGLAIEVTEENNPYRPYKI